MKYYLTSLKKKAMATDNRAKEGKKNCRVMLMQRSSKASLLTAICIIIFSGICEATEGNRLSPLEAYNAPAKAFALGEIIGQPTNPPEIIINAAPTIDIDLAGDLRKKSFLHGNWAFLPMGSTHLNTKGSIENPGMIQVPGYWSWSYGSDDYTKLSKPGPYQQDRGIAWYSCKFTVPSDLKIYNLKLVFEGICAGAEVWLNGKHLKSHIGSYVPFEAELNNAIIWGAENILAVKVADSSNFCAKVLPDGEVKFDNDSSDSNEVNLQKKYITGIPYIDPKVKGEESLGGIIFPVYIEALPTVYINELFINPGLDNLRFDISFEGLSEDTSNIYVKTKIVSWQDGQLLAGSEKEFAVSDKEQNLVSLTNLSPQLWQPQSPNLYNLVIELYTGQKCLDRKIERFGFRTFEVKGSRFYLNSRPYFLRGANRVAYYPWPCDKKWLDMLTDLMKTQGQAVTRFHLEPASSMLLDMCDEKGIMVIWEAANSFARHPYSSPRYWAQARDEYTAMVKACRNRPSIIMWCLGNENAMVIDRRQYKTPIEWTRGGDGLYPAMSRLKDMVHSLDANSRPVLVDGWSMLTKYSDVMDWHDYPGWYISTLYGFQKIIDNRISQTANFIAPQIETEFGGVYTLDDGLFFQKDAARMRIGNTSDPADHLWYQAFVSRELIEMLRRTRLNKTSQISGALVFGNESWFFNLLRKDGDYFIPKPVYYEVAKALQPVLVSFDCWNRHQTAGSDFDVDIAVINDDENGKDIDNCRIFLALKDSCDRQISYVEKFIGTIKYYDAQKVNMELAIPKGLVKGVYAVDAVLLRDSRVVSRNDIKISIYPENYALIDKRIAPYLIGVYGQQGNNHCIETLRNIGFKKISAINNFDKIEKFKLLVIAADGVDDNLIQNRKKLHSYVSKGGRILSLEQSIEKWNDKWLPVENLSIAGNEYGDNAEMNNVEHPVFFGINAMDLRFWNDDTLINKTCFKTCSSNTLAKVFYTRKQEPIDAAGSVIEQIKLGKGEILLNQMLIETKARVEPIAHKLLVNMITYLLLE